jgi:hypothetical protein
MSNLGKMLVSLGVLLVVAGLVVQLAAGKLGWLGRLPGDIRIERPHFQFYAPITTMILLSVAVSAVLWVVGKLMK